MPNWLYSRLMLRSQFRMCDVWLIENFTENHNVEARQIDCSKMRNQYQWLNEKQREIYVSINVWHWESIRKYIEQNTLQQTKREKEREREWFLLCSRHLSTFLFDAILVLPQCGIFCRKEKNIQRFFGVFCVVAFSSFSTHTYT